MKRPNVKQTAATIASETRFRLLISAMEGGITPADEDPESLDFTETSPPPEAEEEIEAATPPESE